MELILLRDIEKVGKEGDTVKVKDGYARNYLIPKKLAVPATRGAARILETRRKKSAREEEKKKKAAAELAASLSKLSLTIRSESGVDDTLFGSVTSEVIVNALREEGVRVDKKSIIIEEPIRKLGVYNVEVRLHPGVKQQLRVWVVKK